MCISCGCGKANDDHGDSRNITMEDLNQAAQAAGTTRDRVLQNIMQGTGYTSAPSQQARSADASYMKQGQEGKYNKPQDQFMSEKQPERHPGDYAPQLGQDSGTDWQESQ